MTEDDSGRCEAKGLAWLCPRGAVAEVGGKWLCQLHLPRDHPRKVEFDGVLANELGLVTTDGTNEWNLCGIVSPESWYGAVLAGSRVRVLLQYADLSGAKLDHAYLRGAKMIYTNLSKTSLISANLNSADLRYANLNDADVYWADLTDLMITNAKFDNCDLGRALWPITFKAGSDGQYAEYYLRIRNNFVQYGRQEYADHFYLEEMRARRKMLRDHREHFTSERELERILSSSIDQCEKSVRTYLDADKLSEQRKTKGFANAIVRKLAHILAIVHSGLRHPLFAVLEYPRFAGFRIRQFLSWLFDEVARYGNSPGHAFAVALLVMLLCASLLVIHTREPWPFLESLFHSVSAFTTLGMTVGDKILKDDFVRALTMIEAWIGSMIMAIFLFSLGRKALR